MAYVSTRSSLIYEALKVVSRNTTHTPSHLSTSSCPRSTNTSGTRTFGSYTWWSQKDSTSGPRPLHSKLSETTRTPSSITLITREKLHKLHQLSALNPPPEGSAEEQELIGELSQLIALMEQVQEVELPEDKESLGRLLSQGVGEVVVNAESINQRDKDPENLTASVTAQGGQETARNRELLDWSTNRHGDFYASRLSGKTGSES
jgi:hypothetical protein